MSIFLKMGRNHQLAKIIRDEEILPLKRTGTQKRMWVEDYFPFQTGDFQVPC